MAAEDQGIMSLPMGGQEPTPPMPTLSLEDSYDAVNQGLQNAAPQAAADIQQLMASIEPQLDQLSDEELSILLQLIQYLYQGGEAEYAKRLQEVIADGAIDPGDLPEDYDPEVLSAIGTVILQAQQQRQGAMQQAPMPPAQFAEGGIAEAARLVAGRGRSGDTMLAHITPEEARLLRSRGGAGTINPETGLPEFFLKKVWKTITGVVKNTFQRVTNAVKKVLQSPIGKILATVALATFLGPGALGIPGLGLQATALGTAGTLGLASGAVTLASGGSLKQALVAGATAYFAAPGGAVSQYVGAQGITNAAANAAISAGIVGTGAGLLTGQKLASAVKSGLTAGAISGLATGLTQGFTSDIAGAPARPQAPVDDRGTMLEATRDVVTPQQVSQSMAQGPAGVATPAAGISPNAELYSPYGFPVDAAVPRSAMGINQLTPQQMEAGIAQPPAAAGAPSATPGIGQSLRTIGGGISDLVQGKEGAFETIKQGASDLFMPKTFTPTELRASDAYAAARAAGATDAAALAEAGKALNPSVFRSYGPAVGAGLGIMALSGGFKPSPVPPSQLAQQLRGTPGLDLIKQSPGQYLTQGLPGVQYDASGNIVGSIPWSPSATMADVRVASSAAQNPFAPPAPSIYSPPPGALGQAQQIAQLYNNPYMYTNLMGPQMNAAQGGLASLARGGYPRKTGAISGPGTEKSDSIPAMLSDGEFVMTAKAVRGAGGGSRREGAKKMYALMHQLERNASRG